MDNIADMLNMVKLAGRAGKEIVVVPHSKVKAAIAECLEKEGYLKSVSKKIRNGHPILELGIIYKENAPRIADLKRVSKPSRRVYLGTKDIRTVRSGHGLLVLSTPKGILTDKQARQELVGGEALFEIW